MPIYVYRCEECKGIKEVLLPVGADKPQICCGRPMSKRPTFPAMCRIKGLGYNSRRKFVTGTAPYTTRATQEWTPENQIAFK